MRPKDTGYFHTLDVSRYHLFDCKKSDSMHTIDVSKYDSLSFQSTMRSMRSMRGGFIFRNRGPSLNRLYTLGLVMWQICTRDLGIYHVHIGLIPHIEVVYHMRTNAWSQNQLDSSTHITQRRNSQKPRTHSTNTIHDISNHTRDLDHDNENPITGNSLALIAVVRMASLVLVRGFWESVHSGLEASRILRMCMDVPMHEWTNDDCSFLERAV